MLVHTSYGYFVRASERGMFDVVTVRCINYSTPFTKLYRSPAVCLPSRSPHVRWRLCGPGVLLVILVYHTAHAEMRTGRAVGWKWERKGGRRARTGDSSIPDFQYSTIKFPTFELTIVRAVSSTAQRTVQRRLRPRDAFRNGENKKVEIYGAWKSNCVTVNV